MLRVSTQLTAIALALAVTTSANAYPQSVRKACAGDYQNYCSQFAPESQQAHRCFERNRNSLTQVCVSALVSAGLVPKKYLKKR